MFYPIRRFGKFSTVAVPVKGTYKDFIGIATIDSKYTVKIMIKTGTFTTANNADTI